MGATIPRHGIGDLFGSNAKRMRCQAPCPIFVTRPLKPGVLQELIHRFIESMSK
jgi:actin-like ATPase involved in cell morphogenesis